LSIEAHRMIRIGCIGNHSNDGGQETNRR
jgi:hypothetical protein